MVDDQSLDGVGFDLLDQFEEDRNYERELVLSDLTEAERRRFVRQDAVCTAFGSTGNITLSTATAGISTKTHDRWMTEDTFGYRGRFRSAEQAWSDRLGTMVLDRLENPSGGRGSDVLLIASKNAVDPNWKGNTVTMELSDEMRDFMQRRQAEDATARAALPESNGVVVEPDGAPVGDEPPPWETE